MGANGRPFVIQNTVVNRIPESTGVRESVPPENSFFNSAQSKNRTTGFFVQNVGFYLDPHTIPDIECVTKHQVLRLGVDIASLKRRSDPRPADLDSAIHRIDTVKARTPHDSR